jgi:hypothetical protein
LVLDGLFGLEEGFEFVLVVVGFDERVEESFVDVEGCGGRDGVG